MAKIRFTPGQTYQTKSPEPPEGFEVIEVLKELFQEEYLIQSSTLDIQAIWCVEYLKKCHYKKKSSPPHPNMKRP
jgi:hypothetical protein